MLRVTTIHASHAAASAKYYAQYLTAAPGEVPGVWSGRQADGLHLSGRVEVDALELLLAGRDPTTGTPLGRELLDRYTSDGRLIRAVAGFDATFSAPKSLSMWWALTGDHRLLDAHDVAVAAALNHLERFGSTTRIRADSGRLHPDTNGLTIATFRQTTSRADDPQIHSHAVISAKVQTTDGRWYALDARYLKKHQRMLGGLYQSALRADLTHRFGVDWRPIVNGQAEIAGIPQELLAVFSKRSDQIDTALADKVDEFRQREGRNPSRCERAALEREASADTRSRKSGHGAPDLTTRWQTEAADAGWSIDRLNASICEAAAEAVPPEAVLVSDVIGAVSQQHSSWCRADVLQTICDLQLPMTHLSGDRWAAVLERATDHVLDQLVDLDPPGDTTRRNSDGRSVWIEPTAPRFTSEPVLVQEEAIVAWAMAAQADDPRPSTTVETDGLDPMQADAAAAVAGHARLVLVVGPAGAGKTRTLVAAAHDLSSHGRSVFAVAPTATAARNLERDTGIRADTVAKLLHEWHRSDRRPDPEYRLPARGTLIVDEAGMLSTPALHQLVTLADWQQWRVVLVGDPRQLQGVGRGGLLAELCANGCVEELERLHRFKHPWEATASLQLRAGDPRALDAYEAHGRIVPGGLIDHLHDIASGWIHCHEQGRSLAVVASTNEHVDTINQAVQSHRRALRHLGREVASRLAGGEHVYLGDVVATRRNDRRLVTTGGEPVRNRDTWTVTAANGDGSITVCHRDGHGDVNLPADYVREHVRLGYAATEHGWESDTVDTSIALISPSTTRRGFYVGATRGSEENYMYVVTDSDDVAEARDTLEAILAVDRADIPATTQRRTLAHNLPRTDTPTPPEPTPRCEIPDWFPSALDDARRALRDAEARDEERAARHAQVAAVAAAADEVLAGVATDTADDRDALRHAETRAAEARRQRDTANYRYDTAARLRRRGPRRELEIAEQQLDRAEHYLERTRQRTAPAVERHRRALADQRHAHEQLRNCVSIKLLDSMTPSVADHRLHVHALTTWHRWAQGHDIPDRALHAAHNVLNHQPGPEQHLGTALRDHLPAPGNAGLPPVRAEVDMVVRITEPDFGIDL